MEHLLFLIDFVLHLSEHLVAVVDQYGAWIYLILFTVIFAETGLVIFPFLPGDSLLFVAGSVATFTSLDVNFLGLILVIAAILGNTVNYNLGRWIGAKVFCHPNSRFFSHKKLARAHDFYERRGASAIVLSRFLPIIRTFVPFVAGMAEMTHARFSIYNIIGAVAWVALFIYGGYFFGSIPFVKENLGSFMMGVVVLTVLPLMIQILKSFFGKKK